MKILLVGEYSHVHWTLAEGLRALGHEVTVASDGDHWKGYPRDIDLRRQSLGIIDSARYILRLRRIVPQLRGYDVVQLINPVFLDLKAQRILPYYRRLRRQNGSMFLGSFGIDKPWVEEGMKAGTFRYSDFYLNGIPRDNAFTRQMEADWLRGPKGELFDTIADDCDGIIASLYENYRCCQAHYGDKLHFVPFPINCAAVTPKAKLPRHGRIRFFIGIQRERTEYKGTDIMLRALLRLHEQYPDDTEIVKAESVPFTQYQEMMSHSDVLLDQLYSYTPAMNALLAMAKGLVVVGGGEEEHYRLMDENKLRPIINVQPSEESVVSQIEERILRQPEQLQDLSRQSVEYIRRHHDHILVAKRFLKAWSK